MLRLREERLKRGWSLARVCQLTGIAESNISAIERGLIPAYAGWQRRIAQAFDMPASKLFKEIHDDECD